MAYLPLGHGSYIEENNVVVNKNSYFLTRNSYIYNQKGQRLKSFRGHRAYIKARTKVKSEARTGYYRKPYAYYNIGHHNYVASYQIEKVNGHGVLFVAQNSYVYNGHGKRQRQKIRAGQLVPFRGPVQKRSNQYYFLVSHGQEQTVQSLRNYRIKGNYYFKIGQGKYIKANNINAVNGNTLYTKGPIKAKVVADAYVYDRNFQKVSQLFKKGSTIKVDQLIRTGMGDFEESYYHVKNSPYYLDSGLLETDPETPYSWSGENGPVLAKQYLHSQNDYQLRYCVADFKTEQPTFYNVQGEKVNYQFAGDELALNQKLYLWNAQEKKAELYYHVQNSLIYQSGAEDERENTAISNLFVKASDVQVSGQTIPTSNTAVQAQTDSGLATEQDKTKLKNAIAAADQVKQTDKYRLDAKLNRNLYQQTVQNAQTVISDNSATKAAVKEALWQVDFAQKNLQGAKVQVKDINHLTPIEAQQILHVAEQSYDNDHTPTYVAVYQKRAHKPGYYRDSDWRGNKKTRYYLVNYQTGKKVLLPFSDFSKEK